MNQITNLTHDADTDIFTLYGSMDGEPVTISGTAGEIMRRLARYEREKIPGAGELANDILNGDKGEAARRFFCAVLTHRNQLETAREMLGITFPGHRDREKEGQILINSFLVLGALMRALDAIAAWSATDPRHPEREKAVKAVDNFLFQYAQIGMFVDPEIIEISTTGEGVRV